MAVTSARRTTRAARVQRRRPKSRNSSGVDDVNISRRAAPATPWVWVRRPPRVGITFAVPTYVPQSQLTAAERAMYLPLSESEVATAAATSPTPLDTTAMDDAKPPATDRLSEAAAVPAPPPLKPPAVAVPIAPPEALSQTEKQGDLAVPAAARTDRAEPPLYASGDNLVESPTMLPPPAKRRKLESSAATAGARMLSDTFAGDEDETAVIANTSSMVENDRRKDNGDDVVRQDLQASIPDAVHAHAVANQVSTFSDVDSTEADSNALVEQQSKEHGHENTRPVKNDDETMMIDPAPMAVAAALPQESSVNEILDTAHAAHEEAIVQAGNVNEGPLHTFDPSAVNDIHAGKAERYDADDDARPSGDDVATPPSKMDAATAPDDAALAHGGEMVAPMVEEAGNTRSASSRPVPTPPPHRAMADSPLLASEEQKSCTTLSSDQQQQQQEAMPHDTVTTTTASLHKMDDSIQKPDGSHTAGAANVDVADGAAGLQQQQQRVNAVEALLAMSEGATAAVPPPFSTTVETGTSDTASLPTPPLPEEPSQSLVSKTTAPSSDEVAALDALATLASTAATSTTTTASAATAAAPTEASGDADGPIGPAQSDKDAP